MFYGYFCPCDPMSVDVSVVLYTVRNYYRHNVRTILEFSFADIKILLLRISSAISLIINIVRIE